MTSVLVLMSTYNGARFLREQLESILSQRCDGEIQVLIRDDGSSDETVSILRKYESSEFKVCVGRNLGVVASYFELLQAACEYESDYYMLADQDDIWLPGKVQRALGKVVDDSGPVLYCSALNLVDIDLQFIGKFAESGDKGFSSLLIRNFATGCTCMMNRKLLSVLRFPIDLKKVVMHDWWIALHAAVFGKIIYDKNSYILYRQHGNNQVGLKIGLNGFIDRFKKYFVDRSSSFRISQSRLFFEENYPVLTTDFIENMQHFNLCGEGCAVRISYIFKYGRSLPFLSALRFLMRA